MGGLRLREGPIRLLLGGMDQIRELDGILDEEDRNVVTDEIPVALLGVELDSEAADIAGKVGGALVAGNGREANEGFRSFSRTLEEIGLGILGERFIGFKIAMRAIAAAWTTRSGMRSWSK